MGQNVSSHSPDNLIPDVENLPHEVVKQAKLLSEISSLTYEEFQKCLFELNELSKKCLDNAGNQLVFAVKKGSDNGILWKAMVKIACVKVDSVTRKIERYKLLNLKNFLQVFKTFQAHIKVMEDSEAQTSQRRMSATMILEQVQSLAISPERCSQRELFNECCICLDRKPEVLLPCSHTYCCPCIEQWNTNKKTCPICQEELKSPNDTWVMSELPELQEVNEEICTELMRLSKDEIN